MNARLPSKKYRVDVIAIILLPIFLTIGAVWFFKNASALTGAHPIYLLTLGALMGVGLLAEAWTLWEFSNDASKDRGILSGLMTGVVLAAPLADRFLFHTFQLPEKWWGIDLGVGALMFLGGTALRWNAKAHLKEFFSHSIRVIPEHRVITTGPYRLIKHPAYFGTLLLVVGNSVVFNSAIGPVLVLLVFPWAWKRMDREETLLVKELGPAYSDYARRVKRVIPWLI